MQYKKEEKKRKNRNIKVSHKNVKNSSNAFLLTISIFIDFPTENSAIAFKFLLLYDSIKIFFLFTSWLCHTYLFWSQINFVVYLQTCLKLLLTPLYIWASSIVEISNKDSKQRGECLFCICCHDRFK